MKALTQAPVSVLARLWLMGRSRLSAPFFKHRANTVAHAGGTARFI